MLRFRITISAPNSPEGPCMPFTHCWYYIYSTWNSQSNKPLFFVRIRVHSQS